MLPYYNFYPISRGVTDGWAIAHPDFGRLEGAPKTSLGSGGTTPLLEFEQFKKKQLMNILPKINGNFGTEKEDENIENNQLNEAWQIIKQSQEKIEHKEVQVYERLNKKQKKDILPKLSGNFGAEIKAENKENGHPDIDKLGPVLNNKSNIKKSQPNHKFHDDLISKNRKILDNLFRR